MTERRGRPGGGAARDSLTLEELATVSGLTVADVSELERFGLVTGNRIAGTTYYDGDCATIAGVAARFRAFGVEARHLRMYRTAVEREAGFFEQVVTPMLKQRNPQARRPGGGDTARDEPARERDARRRAAPGSAGVHGRVVAESCRPAC